MTQLPAMRFKRVLKFAHDTTCIHYSCQLKPHTRQTYVWLQSILGHQLKYVGDFRGMSTALDVPGYFQHHDSKIDGVLPGARDFRRILLSNLTCVSLRGLSNAPTMRCGGLVEICPRKTSRRKRRKDRNRRIPATLLRNTVSCDL